MQNLQSKRRTYHAKFAGHGGTYHAKFPGSGWDTIWIVLTKLVTFQKLQNVSICINSLPEISVHFSGWSKAWFKSPKDHNSKKSQISPKCPKIDHFLVHFNFRNQVWNTKLFDSKNQHLRKTKFRQITKGQQRVSARFRVPLDMRKSLKINKQSVQRTNAH